MTSHINVLVQFRGGGGLLLIKTPVTAFVAHVQFHYSNFPSAQTCEGLGSRGIPAAWELIECSR